MQILGDPHLGRVFTHNVPLNRRGEREEMVCEQFQRELDPQGASLHVCLGDLFNKAQVPYSVLMRAMNRYMEAAMANPDATFVTLRGNHDASKDLQAYSAWEVFSLFVSIQDNIITVNDVHRRGDYLFFGDSPLMSASEIVESFLKPKFEIYQGGRHAFGHWDTDLRGDAFNLLPAAELEAKVFLAVTPGHVHKPDRFQRAGLNVIVHGSMQPYAHGEEVNSGLFCTLTLAEARDARPELLKDRCVQITIQKGETDDLDLAGKIDEFDIEGLFRESMADVPDAIRDQVLARFKDVMGR